MATLYAWMALCYREFMRKALVLFAISLSLLGLAWAQQRMFPEDAKPGALQAVQHPEVNIGNRWYRLSPGVHIVDQRNMTILPTMLPASAQVAYTQDAMGFISNLWLLTPQEASTFPARK
jgi:hypothetical protein